MTGLLASLGMLFSPADAGRRPKKTSPPAAPSATAAAHVARSAAREILRLALRETLLRNGIPGGWISVEGLRSQDGSGVQGTHVRLRLHHWDTRLLRCLVALEKDFARRLALLDGAKVLRVQGVSWAFALPDTCAVPPLPHAGTWTALPRQAREGAAAPEPSNGVIAGPLHVQPPEAGAPRGRTFAATVPGELLPASHRRR